MHTIAKAHLGAAEFLAEYLEAFCDQTGLRWGPNPRSLFWYRPAVFHVLEFFVMHLALLLLYFATKSFYRREVLRRPPTRNPDSTLDLVLGTVLMLCWLSQVVFKALRPNPIVQLCWLAMPCHLITLIWTYVLLTKGQNNWPQVVYYATLACVYHWGPVSAAMFPDWNDHVFKAVEGPVFLVHHGILVAMPFYWALRYELQPLTWRFIGHFTLVATFTNVGIYTLLSYVSGINVNYMLYPPPKVAHWPFLDTPYYRFYVIGLLIVLSIALWLVLRVVNAFGRLFRRGPAGKKVKSS